MNAPLPLTATLPRDLPGWMRLFDVRAIPVSAATAEQIEALRPDEDDIDAHRLAPLLEHDPLMVVRLLAHVGALRRGRDLGTPETVVEALVMLGITPFFRTFAALPTIEEALQDQPQALAGYLAVLDRSYRGARYAMAFAVHRMDPDAEVIREATLLHDFAELLLWWRAPAAALAIADRQRADPALRSAVAQREVLGIELADLEQALMRRWQLPPMLARITDDHHAEDVRVRNVVLALRVARHTARGWDNPALPDDIADVGRLLNLGAAPALRLLHDIEDE